VVASTVGEIEALLTIKLLIVDGGSSVVASTVGDGFGDEFGDEFGQGFFTNWMLSTFTFMPLNRVPLECLEASNTTV
jgi:hypothetical protein